MDSSTTAHDSSAIEDPVDSSLLFGQLDSRREHRLTASMLGDAVGLSKYVTPKTIWQLYTGRLKDQREKSSLETRHGHATEPIAREMYERMHQLHHGVSLHVQPAPFFIHSKKSWLGATPDGLVGDTGLLEIKAPFHDLYKDIPPNYMAQVQGQLEVCDRSFCDFFCLCTRTQQVSLHTVSRSREYWSWIEPLLQEFFACVNADIEPTSLTWPPLVQPPAVPATCVYRGPVREEWKTEGFMRRVAEQQKEIAEMEQATARQREEMDVLFVVRKLIDAVSRPVELEEERRGRREEEERRSAEQPQYHHQHHHHLVERNPPERQQQQQQQQQHPREHHHHQQQQQQHQQIATTSCVQSGPHTQVASHHHRPLHTGSEESGTPLDNPSRGDAEEQRALSRGDAALQARRRRRLFGDPCSGSIRILHASNVGPFRIQYGS